MSYLQVLLHPSQTVFKYKFCFYIDPLCYMPDFCFKMLLNENGGALMKVILIKTKKSENELS